MEKHQLLLGYMRKQQGVIASLYDAVAYIDLDIYENRYVFALKTQQLFTATEDLLVYIARFFENNIEDRTTFHRELLVVMTTEIPNIRPAVLSDETYLLLDKMRSFRHFVRHGYSYELDKEELQLLQKKLQESFQQVQNDIRKFELFVSGLTQSHG